jgi:hypothetical protein
MGTKWGYARVSTEDQELGLQIAALRATGVPEANIGAGEGQQKAGLDREAAQAITVRCIGDDTNDKSSRGMDPRELLL